MKKKDPAKPLNDDIQESFCRHYAGICRETGIKAYLAASGKRISENEAAEIACRLLKKLDIKERIDYLREQLFSSRSAWIICRLAEISENAEKDSDRIRALVCLQKILGPVDNSGDRNELSSFSVSFEGPPEY